MDVIRSLLSRYFQQKAQFLCPSTHQMYVGHFLLGQFSTYVMRNGQQQTEKVLVIPSSSCIESRIINHSVWVGRKCRYVLYIRTTVFLRGYTKLHWIEVASYKLGLVF